MQIFELHFNPKLTEDYLFDSFVYEPENVYEKRIGSLYMVGDLKHTLPSNLDLLEDLSKAINKKHFALSSKNPERALSESLKRANEFLSQEVKNENVSWLGNLNFCVISIKDFNLVFTKTGDLKILLIRNGQIINVGQRLDVEDFDPYPLKIFFNIVSGKLAINDTILILTKDVFSYFQKQNLLSKIAAANPLDSKKIKGLFPSQLFTAGEGAKVSGICFLLIVGEEKSPGKIETILFKAHKKLFKISSFLSFLRFSKKKKLSAKKKGLASEAKQGKNKKKNQIFKKLRINLNFFKKLKEYYYKVLRIFYLKKYINKKYFNKFSQKLKENFIFYSKKLLLKNPKLKKNLTLVAILVLFMIVGFIFFNFF